MKKLFIFSLLCLFMALGFAPGARAQYDPCAITSLPYSEGFESGNLGSCYSVNPLGIINGYLYPQVFAASEYMPAHSGSYFLRCYNNLYSDTAAQVPTLILPQLDESFDLSNIVLDFWVLSNYQTNGVSTGYFVIGVLDNPYDMSTFTAVQTFIPPTINEYVKCTTYFTNYTGSGRYIAIKLAATAYNMMRLDDITLDEVTPCMPVQNLAVNNIAGTDVTITWNPNAAGDASSYNVTLINLATENEFTDVTTDTSYTFSGLTTMTQYRAYVQALCSDGGLSSLDSVSFSTGSLAVTIPYFEDFEGDTTDFLPFYIMQGTGPNQWVYGSAAGLPSEDDPAETGHSLYISHDGGITNVYENTISEAYAILNASFPANDDMEFRLTFDYRVEGEANIYAAMAYDSMAVFLLNSDVDVPTTGIPASATLLFTATNVTEWTHKSIILPNVAGSAKKIVFFWYNNNWNLYGDNHWAAAVDNIRLSGSDCAQPNGLYASDIDMESATLNWNENGSANSWKVYYKMSGTNTDYIEVTVYSDTFVNINGLIANTDYEFYVMANCGTSESEPSDLAIFRTACGSISQLPYIEDFESGIYTSVPQGDYISCWSRLASDPGHYPYISNNDWYAHNGYHFLDFHYTPNCHNLAILPELDATINTSDLLLSFYACHTYSGYWGTLGTLEVGVMTNPEVSTSFVVVDTIDIASLDQYEYAEQLVSLANYNGDGKYIAFRVSNSEDCGFYIDNLFLDVRPACMYPTDFSAVNIGTDSVTLTWAELGEATAWNIQFGASGFTPDNGDGTQVTANAIPFTLGGLDNLTAYDFYVRSDCGDTQSEWVGPLAVVTGVVNMGTIGIDSLVTCEAIICDNGGFDGDYASYCDYMLVVYPATEGSGLQITGTSNMSEGTNGYGESHLIFHDGVSIAGTEIANYTGVHNDIAVAASGPITIHFTSAYYTGAGFMLNVSCASCTPPSNVTATNIQNNSITLSWSGNADQYAVYMSGDASGYYTTTGNSLVVSGLTSNSDYSFQIRSLCGTDSSMLTPAFNVSTTCDAITITPATPWYEDFEGYVGSGNQPFLCWARPMVDDLYGSPFVYCGHAPSCHSGANSAELKGSSAMLVLPVFSNDVHELRFSFWATSTDPSSGTLEVGVMTDFNDPATFELVGTCGTPGPRGDENDTLNGNYMGPFDFANVTATNGRIALRYNNSNSWNSWNLDDFMVEIAPNCSMPTDLTVTNITQNTATATWNAGGNETAWILQHKLSASSDWSNEITVSTPTYDIYGMMPGTAYQVRVKSDCGNGEESGWTTPYDFITAPIEVIQPAVETYAASDITQTSVTLNGAITDPGNQTIILRGFEWKLDSQSDYTQVGTGTGNTLTYSITDLTPNTCGSYRAFVLTVSATIYGETMTFCTLPEDTPEPCETPTGLHVETTDSGEQTNSVHWDNNENVTQWNVQYKTDNSDWTTVTVNDNFYHINNLQYNVLYKVRVQAVCDDNNTSDWTDPVDLMVLCGINDHLLNSITLYPNPANDVVNVQCTMNNVQEVEVIDVYGKVINTVVVTDNPTRINISGLANGMYFVRVTTEQGVATKTFVKR